MNIKIKAFFDAQTSTLTYVAYDLNTKDAIVVDPVLNYDSSAGKISFESFSEVAGFIKEHGLKLHYSLETHAHADHISSSYYLKKHYPGLKLGIGKGIKKTQNVFKETFNLVDLKCDGTQFDHLFEDGEEVKAGALSFKIIHTPGHTPACVSYLVGNNIFVGDTLFMPDYGTARVDFPEGSARELYQSIQKLYKLADSTKVFVGHDYQPNGRDLKYETTIGEQKKSNIQINASISQAEYTRFRTDKDKKLGAPKLLLPAIQVNINGGKLPEPESNGERYLKIPLNIASE